jgi:hypothetical protein
MRQQVVRYDVGEFGPHRFSRVNVGVNDNHPPTLHALEQGINDLLLVVACDLMGVVHRHLPETLR